MRFDDVLALAKAGFTVDQITKLSELESKAPEPAQPAEPAKPAEPDKDTQITELNDKINTIMATMAELKKPAEKEPEPEPIVEQPKETEPKPTIDDLLKSIIGLEQKVQNGLMQAIEQPNPVTAETVLAKIINPPTLKE